MPKQKTYEESIERLEDIVQLLEEGNLPIEQSLSLFEEGTKLSAQCYKTLEKAEQKIKVISQQNEEEGEK